MKKCNSKSFLSRGLFFSILLLLLWAVNSPLIQAAPINGDIFQFKQPDGSFVTVKVWGTELYQYVEGLDGYTLIRDGENGWICYADLDEPGRELYSTKIVYRITGVDGVATPDMVEGVIEKHLRLPPEVLREKQQENLEKLGNPVNQVTTKPEITGMAIEPAIEIIPLTGSVTGLTLLIDFPDSRSQVSRINIDNSWNQSGYTGYYSGSVKDWFYEVSGGKLTYTNIVTEFVTLSKNKSYYDKDCEYCMVHELLAEALSLLDSKGFDFSRLTTENGRIMALNVLYAGSPEMGWARGLWPHAGWYGDFSADGVSTGSYQLSGIGTDGSRLPVGTFIHENGHMVGKWPDLYAYDGHDYGVGNWDSGIPNPYFLHQRDWLELTDLSVSAPGSIVSLPANSRKAAIFSGGNDEYYYIETRRKKGTNSSNPGEGLVIWHVYTKGKNTYGQQFNEVSVVEADGKDQIARMVNRGDSGDPFFQGNNSRFSDTTYPSARWYNGSNSSLNLTEISTIGDTMSFRVGSPDPFIFPQIPSGGGTGLKGEYYDNSDFTNPMLTRTDGVVDFSWSGAPAAGMGADYFSVRWSGMIQPPYSGEYCFWVNVDDGIRLWVNNTLIIDSWKDQGTTEYIGKINLSGGAMYPVKIEYYEKTYGAVMRLFWSSKEMVKRIIQADRLYLPGATMPPSTPTPSPTPTPTPTPTPVPALKAHYRFEGNLSDAAGGISGVPGGNPGFEAGVVEQQCLLLDGVEDYVTIPLSVSYSFTLSFWIKTTDTGGTGEWWSGKGLVDGEVGGATSDFGTALVGDKLALGVGNPDTTVTGSRTVNDGKWHHVAATRDGASGGMALFVDGSPDGSKNGPPGPRDAPAVLRIGSLQTGLNFFKGSLDELRIYNYVLGAGEIRQLSEAGNSTGDVNGDGSINIIDALMIAQKTVGLDPAGFIASAADVNRDGIINIIDALMVAQLYVGLIQTF